MELERLNDFYRELEERRAGVAALLSREGIRYSDGWFNGHYTKDAAGEYRMDYYPIPVTAVEGVCDIEIRPDGFSVSAKLRREAALNFDYSLLSGFRFEAYGVEDYLADYYVEGDTPESLRENIRRSAERDIGFSFSFGSGESPEKLLEFVGFLRANGFFY